MTQNEVASAVGCSRTNLIRWARDAKLSLDSQSYRPEVVRAVCNFYEMHGKQKTQKAFPNVKVRSIIERNSDKFSPRQTRWTDDQIKEAARMAGLVPPSAQAKYFSRPRANAGSIRSLWMKRFGFGQGNINGMPHWQAKHFVNQNARYIKPIGDSRSGKLVEFRKIILWVDMEKCLKPDVAPFMRDAIASLANFQRWLWSSNDPKPQILKMMRKRIEHWESGA